MVKPTSGICCEFAQKHDAEFVQNFFEKLLDKSARQVYNSLASNGKRLSAEARRLCCNKYLRRHKMELTAKIVGGRGRIPISPVSGRVLELGEAYTLAEWSAGSMTRVIIPDMERGKLVKKAFLPVRGGVKHYQPTDGRGMKYGVEVRAVIPNQPHRLELKALMMTAGFSFQTASRWNTVKTVLDSGSWTAFLQSHAGEADVTFYVRDRKTGLDYCCNLATVDPKSAEITAIQQAHGTNTTTAKRRGNSKTK